MDGGVEGLVAVEDGLEQIFVSQEFVAGDDCQYEDKDGNPVDSKALDVDGKEAYLPFDMVQPKNVLDEAGKPDSEDRQE